MVWLVGLLLIVLLTSLYDVISFGDFCLFVTLVVAGYIGLFACWFLTMLVFG